MRAAGLLQAPPCLHVPATVPELSLLPAKTASGGTNACRSCHPKLHRQQALLTVLYSQELSHRQRQRSELLGGDGSARADRGLPTHLPRVQSVQVLRMAHAFTACRHAGLACTCLLLLSAERSSSAQRSSTQATQMMSATLRRAIAVHRRRAHAAQHSTAYHSAPDVRYAQVGNQLAAVSHHRRARHLRMARSTSLQLQAGTQCSVGRAAKCALATARVRLGPPTCCAASCA